MKDSNQSGINPEQNRQEDESTKGFPVVTEQDEADAASFEMKKKDKDGSWVAATPVRVTDDTVKGQAAAAPSEQDKQTAESARAAKPEKQAAQKTAPLPKQPPVAAAEPENEYDEEDEEEGQPPRRRAPLSRGKRIAAAVAGAAVVAVAGFSIFVYTYSDIFPGVRVAGEYKLSGMTQEEAQAYISGDVQAGVFGQELKLTGKDLGADQDKEYTIQISDVAASLDAQTSAAQAYQIGREGGYFQRVGTVFNSMFTGWDVSLNASLKDGAVQSQLDAIASDLAYDPVQPSWNVDKEKSELTIQTGKQGLGFDKDQVVADVTARVQEVNFEPYEIETYAVDQNKPDAAAIAKDVNCDPKNATVDKEDGETVIEAVDGVQVEEKAIADAVGDASKESYTVPVTLTEAKVKKADLEPVLFRDTLASTTTYYNGGQAARTTNVRLASNACDGVILNPGEEFSYNDVVGERTAARGYRSAIIFQEGQEVNGLGGGVCQPSSTLYMAVLRADLDVTERHYHQFQVSYTPISQDATVAYGSKDFKFVNDTEYPVKIVVSMGGGSLTFSIVGTKTDDKTVSLYARTYTSGKYKNSTLYKTVTVNGESTTNKENSSSYLLK